MSAYIPLIKTTRWIDLSADHKKLRIELEQDTLKACINKEQMQPIMLQGAFGIGKTNSLYYLFHYGWCKLKTPTFLVSLDEITKAVKEFASSQSNGKIQNDELGRILSQILNDQINTLKEGDWSNMKSVYFPEFKGGNLNKYLEDFKQVEVIEDSKEQSKFDSIFSEEIIKQAITSGNRVLLLIDEFESKFYELKKYIETSGGGVLRELFDQIVQDTDLFYLIIGNGPASGYEIARERGDVNSDSETAANRRLKTKPIPFPTSNLLQRSFLKGDPKGYINFIWWLSRCRPGHILKLRDSLGTVEDLKLLNTNELITKSIFKEPIDEGGEAVSYLKTQFFNDLNGRIQAAVLGKVLTEFQPLEFDIKDFKNDLRNCVTYFLCGSQKINTEIDLIPVLREDLYVNHLKNFKKEGKFDSVNYIEHIQPYFSYILSGISDSEGNIAFGMINDTKPDEILESTFLIPLLELSYDFISLYQDDSVKETRESLDFLLHLISLINKSKADGTLELCVPNIFDCFEKCKLLRNDKVNLQLSLYAIRESIEQPIGSPILKYKNEQLSELISTIKNENEMPIIFYKEDNLYNYIIPTIEENSLEKYLENLQDHLCDLFYSKFHRDGMSVIRVIYFEFNNKIDEFRNNLLYKDGDLDQPEPIYSLSKIDVVDFESFQLNFGGQIRDYVDSVSKISLVGNSKGEISIVALKKEDKTINLKDIINLIGDRLWTEKKETIRTIEHYRKLLFDGENSTFKMIHNIANSEYKAKLEETVCKQEEFRSNVWEYSFLDKLIKDESESYDLFTTDLALLYLFENKSLDESIKQLLELCKNEYKFDVDKEDVTKAINFKNLLSILTKNKKELESLSINFDLSSSFISKLSKLTGSLIDEVVINIIDDYFSFLSSRQDNGFIKSYHNALGGYLLTELTDTLYSLNYLKTISIQDAITVITKEVNELEKSFSVVRVNIVSKLDELKTILDESQSLSSYPENLNKALKGIALIKKVLDNEISHSTALIIFSVIQHLSKVVKDAKSFNEQLDEIYDDVILQKEKIDLIQEEIDKLYEDNLTKKLIGFEFPIPRNNGYLWKKRYLKDKIKDSEEYEKLFGESKYYYNPYTRPTIYPDKIEKFYKALVTITNNLSSEFNEMVAKMREIKKSAESTTQLQGFINQLLTQVEE
jgi:hypothetical protein